MSDVVAEIFGYLIFLIALGLISWEAYVYRRGDAEASWLQTPGRFRRRVLMGFLLICVSALIVSEARDLIVLDNVRHLVIYLGLLAGLAFLLFILSIRDLGDMARSAEKHAIEDLKHVLEEQQRVSEQSSESAE